MFYLKKSKMGKSKIRKIVVNDVNYYWTIHSKGCYGYETIICHIGLAEQKNHRFSFIDTCYTAAIIPSLIKKAIEFANEHINWQHTKASSIQFNTQGFSCHNSID